MKKSVNQVLLAGLIVLMMVGTSFAGTSSVNNGFAGNPLSISLETLGSARNVVLVGSQVAAQNLSAGNVPISYTLTQDMTTQNLLQVSLTNAAFNGNPVFMCAPSAANATNTVRIGTGTPAAGATTFNFQSAANVPSNSYVFLTDYACPVAETLVTAAAQNLSLRVPATSSVVTGSIEMRTVTAGNIPVDPSSNVTAFNIAREFATTLTTRNMLIDYLNASAIPGPGDGTRFDDGASSNIMLTSNGAAAANMFAITRTATNYTTVVSAGLTTAFNVNIAAITDWTGANNSYMSNWSTCAAANISGAAVTPPASTGAVNLAAVYAGVAAASYDLCIGVNGATELTPRTITGTAQVAVFGVGANQPTGASGTFQTWITNGFQAYVPHMRWDSVDNTRTFVRFVNRANRAASSQVAVQRNGAAAVTYSLASIPANGIVTYSARTIADANGITDDNYAALFTVKTGRNNIHAEAFFNLVGFGTRNAVLYENPTGKDFQLK